MADATLGDGDEGMITDTGTNHSQLAPSRQLESEASGFVRDGKSRAEGVYGEPSAVAGTVGGTGAAAEAGLRAMSAHDARVVGRVMKAIRPKRGLDISLDAGRILADRGPSGRDGAFGQVSGKVHEYLAAARHNRSLGNLARRSRVRLDANPSSPVVDAMQVSGRQRVTQLISYKKSAGGAARAAPFTPADVTIAVPIDQVAAAQARIGATATSSGVTTNAVDAATERGARALAANNAAGSLGRAAGRAGLSGAGTAVVIGGISDYRRLVRHGQMGWARFAAERGADAAEGAIGGVAGVGGAAATAAVLAGSTAATGAVLPVALPAAAALGTGLAVGAVTRRVRRSVTTALVMRQDREAVDDAATPPC